MTILFAQRALVISAAVRTVDLPPLTIDPQTASITLRIARPTTGGSVVWPVGSTLDVSITALLDDQPYTCQGRVSGGIRTQPGRSAVESPFYQLRYTLPYGFFGQRAGAPKRLGETRQSTFQARVNLAASRGNLVTSVEVSANEAPAPDAAFHSSVAFDTATDAGELFGDGVLSLSHTSSGADRAVFAFVGNSGSPPRTSTSCTHDGATMVELWDVQQTFFSGAGYQLHAQATGTKTVTNTLANATDDHVLSVLSFTGVDQSTPVGTPVTASNFAVTSLSVTVLSVGADDLVVDGLYVGDASNASPTVGASQTERTREAPVGDNTVFGVTSTQSGADGGVMSWTFPASLYGAVLGAVAFKAAAGGAILEPPFGQQAPLPRERPRWAGIEY